MNGEAHFIATRRKRWAAYAGRLETVRAKGPAALPGAELLEFAAGYRSVTADLAKAKTRGYSPALQRRLNAMTAGGYAVLYQDREEGGLRRAATFYLETFPRELRRSFRTVAACAALFVAATIVSNVCVAANTESAYAFLAEPLVQKIRTSLHDSNFKFDSAQSSAVASEIITNNVRVAAVAFAGGATLGIMTVSSVVENGFMLGAMEALYADGGFGYDFVATVAPHGAIELSAIVVAASGGLLMAGSIVAPGRLRRREALVLGARRAVVLALGAFSMLVIAGTIEGFFTPLRTPPEARLAVGAMTAVLLVVYFTCAGRRAPEPARLMRR